jgi:putative FmdB family regulatory protein
MPMYEYLCTACGHTLDALQKMSDAPLKECPACHQDGLQKQVSLSSFQLKGTGWYATDHKTPKSQTDGRASAEKVSGSDTNTKSADAPANANVAPAVTSTSDSKTDK